MNRLSSFFFGFVAGAVSLYIVMTCYIVRASDGVHLVPKLAAKLEMPYVDIRNFTLQDWQKNQSLAMSIMKANKGDMMKDSTLDNFKRSTQNILDQVMGK